MLPQTPSLSTTILASSLPLQADEIHYLAYEGDYSAVWDLRRKVVDEEERVDQDILSSTLWSIQVVSSSVHRLWLFHVGNNDFIQDDRLSKVCESSIIPSILYPCSEECSHQTTTCGNCHNPTTPSTARHLPRRPWRLPWHAFLDAVRAALTRRAVQNNTNPRRWAAALKNGFVFGSQESDEWITSGWEHVRSLTYTHIHVHLALEPTPRLIVHPTITPTPYYTMNTAPVAGTALTLLPYGTPAYFVAPYSGPSSALTAQFKDALCGLAVNGWCDQGLPRKNGKSRDGLGTGVNYAIVYIPVHVPHSAERKGITVIYPTRLVLTLPRTVRAPLDARFLPVLPASLQPSPLVAAAVVPSGVVIPSSASMMVHSPIATTAGPRSAYPYPPPPTANPNTNVFPTLNSPLAVNYNMHHMQQQQQPTAPSYPFPPHPHPTSAHPGFSHLTSAVSGTPYSSVSPPAPLPAASAGPALSSGGAVPTQMSQFTINLNLLPSKAVLLKAHRAVSTASQLFSTSSSVTTVPSTPAASGVPTPGAPTPGTVGAPTPGGPSTSSVKLPTAIATLIPGTTTSTLQQTAAEVSAYVDYVAKEREKERERLRDAQREAQAQRGRMVSGSGSGSSSTSASNGASISTSHPSVPPLSIPSSTPIASSAMMMAVPLNSTHSSTSTDAQMFYPSPPTNPPSVSAAGNGAIMSPVLMQGPLPLPQIPQGLPSMHDAAAVAGQRPAIALEGPINSNPREETELAGHEVQTGTVTPGGSTVFPSEKMSAPPVAPVDDVSSYPATETSPAPDSASGPAAIFPSDENSHTAPSANVSSGQTSSWGFYGGDDMDLDELGMLGGVGAMSGDGMAGMSGGDDIGMGIFGAGPDNFNLENLGNWEMDPTFGFGSSEFGSGAADHSSNGSVAVYGGNALASTSTSSASFPSFNGFGQPMAPAMVRAATAPTHQSTGSGSGSGSGLGNLGPGGGIGMDFEADFTDDDFSFFDTKSPSKSDNATLSSMPPPPSSAPPVLPSGDNTASDPLSFLNQADSFFTSFGLPPPGSTPTSYPYLSHPTPHSLSHPTPGGPSGFTPLTVDIEVDAGLPSPPEELGLDRAYEVQLEGSSPMRPSPHSLPSHSPHSKTPSSPAKDRKFAPIPFAKSHVLADGKYRAAGGKFALLRSKSGWLHKDLTAPKYFSRRASTDAVMTKSEAEGTRRGSWSVGRGTGPVETKIDREGHAPSDKEAKEARKDAELERGPWALPSPPLDSDTSDSDDEEPDSNVRPLLTSPLGPSLATSSSNAPPPPTANTSFHPSGSSSGWRPRYDCVTDPRVRVVRKLISSKRRSTNKNNGSSLNLGQRRKRPKWVKDWEAEAAKRIDVVMVDSDDSDVEDDATDVTADDDDWACGEEEGSDNDHGSRLQSSVKKNHRRERSRPTTPLPSYLPPGPALVSTCFHWVHLLEMAGGDTNSVNAGSDPLTTNQDSHPTPVPVVTGGVGITHGAPTPVSPTGYGPSMPTPTPFATSPGATWNQPTPSASDSNQDRDKMRALEAVANTVARECVENRTWSDAWSGIGGLIHGDEESAMDPVELSTTSVKWEVNRSTEGVWPADLRTVKQLLVTPQVFGEHVLSVGDLFESSSTKPASASTPTKSASSSSASLTTATSSKLQSLKSPLLSVVKSDAIVQLMPTALNFWEKLGLGPRSGRKNVTTWVLFEEGLNGRDSEQASELAGRWRQEQIGQWLKNMTERYSAKHLGAMVPGKVPEASVFCQTDGLARFRFDSSFKKDLASFIASLPSQEDSLVCFIIIPLSVMTLASETLRQLFSAVKKAAKSYCEAQILFQFVPETHVFNCSVNPSSPQDFGSESLLYSVYDRILIPVDRVMARKFFEHGERVRKFFQMPAFTLARSSVENKVSYSCSVDASLDVLDRHTFLHVGYQLSSCGKWILAACIDQRGEAHDIGVWLTRPHLYSDKESSEYGMDEVVSDEMYVVGKIWEFAMQFAEQANVEWRVVFSKLGTIGAVELDAWVTHLSTALHSISKNAQTPVHVSLLAVEPSVPWLFLSPSTSQSSSPSAAPHSTPSRGSSSLSRSVSGSIKSSSKTQLFVDTSTTTYSLVHKHPLPISAPTTLDDLGLAAGCVVDNSVPHSASEDHPSAYGLPLLPLNTSTLVRIPTDPSAVLSHMIHIHLLHASKSEGCSYPSTVSSAAESHPTLLRDITRSFHSLSVLSSARWGMAAINPLLPFHLGAVQAMRNALSVGKSKDGLH